MVVCGVKICLFNGSKGNEVLIFGEQKKANLLRCVIEIVSGSTIGLVMIGGDFPADSLSRVERVDYG